MTQEEKITILTEAQERAYKQLELTEGCEMGSEDFGRLLYAIQQLDWFASSEASRSVEALSVIPSNLQPETPQTETVVEPTQPEPGTGVDESQYKMEDVRAALAKARTKGVNVAEIIRSFGVDSFPAIPKSQYGAVMEKLEGAVKNAT